MSRQDDRLLDAARRVAEGERLSRTEGDSLELRNLEILSRLTTLFRENRGVDRAGKVGRAAGHGADRRGRFRPCVPRL